MFFQAHRVSLQTESSSEETCIVVKFISMAFSSLQSRFAQVFHFLGASFLEIFIRNQCQQMIGEKATIHGVSKCAGAKCDYHIFLFILLQERRLEIRRKKFCR